MPYLGRLWLKVARDEAEDLFLHVHGVAFGERDIDPGADEEIYQAARFGNQFAFDHLLGADAQGLAEYRQHARVAADGGRGEFFTDLLGDAIFQYRDGV